MRSKKVSVTRRPPRRDSGATLYIVAGGMVFLLGASGLAIDLGALYVGRSEAQRAADAAALAGATVFVNSTCTGTGANGCLSGTIEAQARAAAEATGNKNLVGGGSPNITDADISFVDSTPNGTNPRITVNVHQSMPTFFMKIFGVSSSMVAATATAEAYNPSNGNTPINITCIKPWVMPNCDPESTHTGPGNSNCGGAPVFIDTTTNPSRVVNLGPEPTGVIGEYITLKPGDPSMATRPGWYFPIQLNVDNANDVLCPSCAGATVGGSTGASVYRENVCCCNTEALITCGGSGTVDLGLSTSAKTGNMQGPTQQGVSCLINELDQGDTRGSGQDTLCAPYTVLVGNAPSSCYPPLNNMYGGSNNPNPSLRGQLISSSGAIVAVPLYDGHMINNNVNFQTVGFLQLFVDSVDLSNSEGNKGDVNGTIVNIVACPTGGGGGSNAVSGGGAAAIPVRLVQTP